MDKQTKTKLKTIDFDRVSFIEANRCYAKIFYKNKKQEMASKPLANYEQLLCRADFIRCHRAFLINIDSVKRFDKKNRSIETFTGHKISVSHRKLKDIAQIIEQKPSILAKNDRSDTFQEKPLPF